MPEEEMTSMASQIVKKHVNEYDSESLLKMGCPADEYEPEIRDITFAVEHWPLLSVEGVWMAICLTLHWHFGDHSRPPLYHPRHVELAEKIHSDLVRVYVNRESLDFGLAAAKRKREGGDMPEEKVSHDEHVCKPSCHNPCLLDKDNPYKRAAADAGPRQPRTYRIVDKSIAGSDERTQFLQSAPVPQKAAPRKTRDQMERETPILEGLYCPRCDAYHSARWHKDEVNVASWATQATSPDEAMRVAEQIIVDFGRATPSMSSAFKRHIREVAALIREAGSERERVENDPNYWFYFADRVGEKIGWPFTKLEELAEILKTCRPSRLLGGESK